MTRIVLLMMLLSGCVSRTNVGSEPAPGNDDGGVGARPDAALDGSPDATLSPEQEDTRGFERELVGTWQGPLATPFGTIRLEMTFFANSRYRVCVQGQRCTEPGLFFVTDRTSNGHYAGELQDSAMRRTSYLDDMWIDHNSAPETLHFALYDDLFLSVAELTRLDD